MKPILRSSKLLLILSLFFLIQCDQKKGSNSDSDQNNTQGRALELESEVSFLDSDNQPFKTIKVAVADDAKERSQGLMDVYSMAEDEGMIFIFEKEELQSFWMANTPLTLDIMYVNADSTIVRIHQNTEPFSQTSLPSEAPAQYVIETNGGFSIANGITEGMKVRF